MNQPIPSIKLKHAGQVSKHTPTEHFDVMIIGAGISGIAGAYYLQNKCPDKNYVILDTEEQFGGTWWTHTYPGIRSDSDLFTFGYSFKPWTGARLATGERILQYMGEVIEENDISKHIRYKHRVLAADWSEVDRKWVVVVQRPGQDDPACFSTSFLFMCQGYFRHREGHMPKWDGVEAFKGKLVHSENWPEDTVYEGKKVAVIGSGATAASLIPALTGSAKHVTMVQRSPTYFSPGRNVIEIAERLRKLKIDDAWIHEITRREISLQQQEFMKRCFQEPKAVKDELIEAIRDILGPDFDVDTHFSPNYDPWTQRLAVVPDADLFECVKEGKASVVTGHIDRFVDNGILMKNGDTVESDLVVAATGFNMSIMGDINFSKDGIPIDFHETITYRGTMFTGVPNLAWVFGYFRASWTLRSEMISALVCRMINHMDDKGFTRVEPVLRDGQKLLPVSDWVNSDNFDPNYLKRANSILPQRLNDDEWQHTQDYWKEKTVFPAIDVADKPFSYD